MSIQEPRRTRHRSEVNLEETRRRFLLAREQAAQHRRSVRDLRPSGWAVKVDSGIWYLESD